MSEQKVQAKILKWLHDQGYWTVKTVVSNRKGIPDILACSPEGRFIAIEVKAAKGKPTKLQEWNIEELKKRKAIAMIAYSLEDVIALL